MYLEICLLDGSDPETPKFKTFLFFFSIIFKILQFPHHILQQKYQINMTDFFVSPKI